VYDAIEDALDGRDIAKHQPQLAALHWTTLSKLRRAAAFREDVNALPPPSQFCSDGRPRRASSASVAATTRVRRAKEEI
jgi:hypothetical protein